MSPKVRYTLYCILGSVLPLRHFLPWLLQHGFNLPLFFALLFANPISRFFAADVLVSAAVILHLAFTARKQGLHLWWLPILATLLVGGSLGLPLLLLLRERQPSIAADPLLTR